MMILVDSAPYYCPYCGKYLRRSQEYLDDFDNGAAILCTCGAMFHYVPKLTLIETLEVRRALALYVREV